MAANKLTEEQINEIVSLYQQDTSISQLAKQYEVSYPNIRKLLLKRNLLKVNPKHRRLKNPNLDLELFKKIDTSFKAYLLGLICADGHISKNVEITLQEKDKELLECIKTRIGMTSDLIFKKGVGGNRQNAYRLFICSKEIVNQLNIIGLTNNKTEDLSIQVLDHVPNSLLRDFVRGFFDGDGCITETKNEYDLNLIGCQSFIEPLKDLLETVLGIHFSITKHGTTSYIRTIRVSGRYQCIKFAEWMYAGSTIYMQRKYDKYQELVNSQQENPYGKLALKDYDIICELYNSGKHTYNELAKLYNINRSHVARILKGYRPKTKWQ